MNLFQYFEQQIKKTVEAIDLPAEALNLLEKISAEPPRDPSHGDVATNAAMVLAKPAKKNPRDIAQKIVDELSKLDSVEEAVIAGPGFINLRLSNRFWLDQLKEMLAQGGNYGRGLVSNGEQVNAGTAISTFDDRA